MFKKRAFFVILLAMAVLFSGCGAKITTDTPPADGLKDNIGTADREELKVEAEISIEDDTESLTVLLVGIEQNMVINYANLVNAFERASGVEVEVITCASSLEQAEKLAEMQTDGEMPDVILMNGYSEIDFRMMAREGLLLDLSPYMEASEDFSRGDYYEALLDAGYFGGGQYIMPIGFQLPLLLTSQERMEKYELALGAMTGRETMAYLTKLVDDYEDEEIAKVFYHSLSAKRDTFMYTYLGLEFFDYDTLDIIYKPEDIMLTVDFSKKVNADILNNIDFTQLKTFQTSMQTASRSSILQLVVNGGHYAALGVFPQIYGAMDETTQIFCLPGADAAEEYNGLITAYGVVSAETIAPHSALKLLQHITGEFKDSNYASRASANKKALDSMIEGLYISSYGGTSGDALKEDFRRILENMTSATIMDNGPVTQALHECFKPYNDSLKSFDECLADFDEKMTVYQDELNAR